MKFKKSRLQDGWYLGSFSLGLCLWLVLVHLLSSPDLEIATKLVLKKTKNHYTKLVNSGDLNSTIASLFKEKVTDAEALFFFLF